MNSRYLNKLENRSIKKTDKKTERFFSKKRLVFPTVLFVFLVSVFLNRLVFRFVYFFASVHRFPFSRIKSAIFLIVIPDSIFVLV